MPRPSRKERSSQFLSKVNSNQRTVILQDLTWIAGPPEAAQDETQTLEAALLDEEVDPLS